MKVLTYAISKSFDTNLIPRLDEDNRVLYTDKVYSSRTIKNLNFENPITGYQGTDNDQLALNLNYWSDYKYDNIKYILEYNLDNFIENINSGSNLFDRVLSLNPKQVGIVNTAISKSFCEGNEIHFASLKYSMSNLLYTELNGSTLNSLNYARNVYIDSGIMGWGEVKLNNSLFCSLADSFNSKNNTYVKANETSFAHGLTRRLKIEDINNLLYVNYKTKNLGEFAPFFIYQTGINAGKSFINIDDEIYTEYSIKLVNGTDFSSEGSLKGILNRQSGLLRIDEELKKLYFWKSALITTISEDREINYYLVVGVKPFRYLLTKQIDRIFFVDLGNTLLNTKFDNTDIVLYESDLKTFFKKSNAKTVYFTDLSNHPMGNICPNGLAFGANSTLLTNIVTSINSGSSDYSSVEYQINNIYNIFISLEE
jgi:hypothetical protein